MILSKEELEKNKERKIQNNIENYTDILKEGITTKFLDKLEEEIVKANQESKTDLKFIYTSENQNEIDFFNKLFTKQKDEFYSEVYLLPILRNLFPDVKFKLEYKDRLIKNPNRILGLMGSKIKSGKEIIVNSIWS